MLGGKPRLLAVAAGPVTVEDRPVVKTPLALRGECFVWVGAWVELKLPSPGDDGLLTSGSVLDGGQGLARCEADGHRFDSSDEIRRALGERLVTGQFKVGQATT